MVERAITGAKYGTRDWLLQRITAFILLFYTLFILTVLFTNRNALFVDWQNLFSRFEIRVANSITFICLVIHAWIGMRDVLMDYVRASLLRLVLHVVVVLLLAVYLIWAAHIFWVAR